MELRHLRYFLAVAETLNFTAAAKRLQIAQPPLSVQIRHLEEELGAPLFKRTNRKVALTPAGRNFLSDAQDIVRRADEAAQRAQDAAAGRLGEIRLAVTAAAFAPKVIKRIRRFVRKNRGVRVSTEWIDEGMAQSPSPWNGADVLVASALSGDAPDGAQTLFSDVVGLAIPPKHRLVERADVAPSDLIGEMVLVAPLEDRSAAEKCLLARLADAGVSFSTREGSRSLVERLWEGSLGLGIAVCTAGEADRLSLDCKFLPLAAESCVMETFCLTNPVSQAAALPVFTEFLLE
ncbi:MAG TPA: LysR family transcriptional regulator [Chthoniobacterales bacterium]